MKEYVAYIDEAGDEGFGKLSAGPIGGQSRWLVLGACIVSRENDLKLPLLRDEILARFPKRKSRDLHFRDLNHAQKIVACQAIAKFRLGVCVALSHKVTIPGTKYETTFKKKQYLYNFMVRWLLERLTSVCARVAKPDHCTLKLVFSRRGGTNYQVMKDYLILMREGREVVRPVRSIDWSVLDVNNIAVENHSKWAGLQIADCTTSAYFAALEPNLYGNSEPNYAHILKSKLLKDAQGRVLNCGVTPVPSLTGCGASEVQLSFFRSLEEGGQAPGL